jgi:disulfide oxidoreductase YuzD
MGLQIKLYTVPQAACDSGKMNWIQAGELLQRHLKEHLGNHVDFQHIEFMADKWFEDATAQQVMEKEDLNFPFVMINGELASTGPKIKMSQIVKKAKELQDENR